MTVVRDQLFPQKPPGSRFRFSPTGVQPSPGSSTIEVASAFAESGAYPPDTEIPGSPRQCSLPLACRHSPEGHQIGARKRRTPENTILSQPCCRRAPTDRPNREGSQLAASLEGKPGPIPAGKTLPHSYPEPGFGGRGQEVIVYVVVVVVFFTLTDRASTIPSNIRGCQSGTWSQKGAKVNGSHHGDNPLLRPTGIQIATIRYATLQAMEPTNNKTVHQTSFTPYREQPRLTRIVFAYPRPAFSATNRTNTFQPVLINNSKFLKATHRTEIRKTEIQRSMVVEALSW